MTTKIVQCPNCKQEITSMQILCPTLLNCGFQKGRSRFPLLLLNSLGNVLLCLFFSCHSCNFYKDGVSCTFFNLETPTKQEIKLSLTLDKGRREK